MSFSNIRAIFGPYDLKMPTPSINSTFTPAEVLSSITDRVRQVRRENGLSQREFAEACSIPERTYKRIEAGKCDSLSNLVKIICYLNRQASFDLFFLNSDLPTVPRTAPQKAVHLEAKIRASKK